MANQNSLFKRWGALVLPVESEAVDGTLAPLDPARDKLLNLFADAINGELEDVWAAVAHRHPELQNTSPVETRLPTRPSLQTFRELKMPFPILSVNREGNARFSKHSIVQRARTQEWGVNYFLLPLDAADERRLADILNAIPDILDLTLGENSHPNHNGGSPVFEREDFASIAITTAQSGQAAFAGNADSPMYWSCSMTLETVELSAARQDAYPPLNGMCVEAGTGNADGLIYNIVLGDTEAG